MRTALFFLCCCSCLFLRTAAAGGGRWTENPVEEDGFTVQVPATSECLPRTDREQPTFDGRLNVRRYGWTTPEGLQLGVQWYDLPEGAPAGFEPWTARLQQSRALGNDSVRLSAVRKAAQGRGSAQAYYVDMQTELASGVQLGRAYRSGGRVYMVFGMVPAGSSVAEDVVAFVRSFQFLPEHTARR